MKEQYHRAFLADQEAQQVTPSASETGEVSDTQQVRYSERFDPNESQSQLAFPTQGATRLGMFSQGERRNDEGTEVQSKAQKNTPLI